MQEKTGHMTPISRAEFEEFERLHRSGANVPPIFEVGETLVLRGGKFRVEEIHEDGLRLVGVPFETTVGRASAARRGRR